MLDGLGYNNRFFTFIGKGWSLSVSGIAIALMGVYLGLEKDRFKTFLQDMTRFLPVVGILLGLIFLSLLWINIINHQVDTLFAKGEYHQVLAKSQTLLSWHPPLRGNEAFLKRMAEAGFYGNEPDPALINFTKGIERYSSGDYLKAEKYLQKCLNIQPNLFLARGYLATTILNEGVEYFNSPNLPESFHGNNYPNFLNSPFNPLSHNNPSAIKNSKPSQTIELIERTLQIFPGHIEALYNLMLITAINTQFNRSAEVAQEIIDIQKYFQQPKLGLLGQAYLYLAWAEYHKDNDPTQAWKRYRQSIDSKSWKKLME